MSRYDFDIAVSFAGEDWETIQQYCKILSSNGLRVFYDKYERIGLWGANLYDKLDEVYRTKALFCVIFISKH
ncbi:MAG: toll/interleukin-1 receptor domain-containing protein, partial [Dehalococcoidia bacterium]|nr:toll/interleukin-1 receptor domain-containing protein [Dehalococcoidia bacterium]